MSSGGYVLLVAVLAALAFGTYRALVDGRFRGTHAIRGAAGSQHETTQPRNGVSTDTAMDAVADTVAPAVRSVPSVLDGTPWSGQLGEQATFVQFSSAFCAPCRATRRVLTEVAAQTPGVVHVEVDAEQHLDLVRRLRILRTPTTLVLDAAGTEITRAAGAPTKAQVQAAIAAITG